MLFFKFFSFFSLYLALDYRLKGKAFFLIIRPFLIKKRLSTWSTHTFFIQSKLQLSKNAISGIQRHPLFRCPLTAI